MRESQAVSIAEFVAVGGEVIDYRVVPGSGRAVVVMHGGHMHAGIELGEQVFRDMGYTVIVPSRPGYGNTPAISGGDRTRFADAVAELVVHLGCGEVAAVVGISAGGPSAITLASRHRELVRRVVLENSISDRSWPDRRTRFVAKIVFGPKVERVAWAATRLCLRVAPLDRHLSAATLSINRTSSHLMWFGPASESIPQSIRHFLTS